ncbi:MAG: hypothetical protein U0790_17175 [Isosphaeraceae bacterium]
MPPEVLLVSEGGIRTRSDVEHSEPGVAAILVGSPDEGSGHRHGRRGAARAGPGAASGPS